MSEPISLAQAGIDVTTTAHLASPSLLGEYVASLDSGDQALFLDGLARGFDAIGSQLGRGLQVGRIGYGVRGLGDARSKAVRKLVADLHYGLGGAS